MCGIVGCVARSNIVPILLDGLHRLEYRGYDSAGIACLNGSGLQLRKSIGRIAELAREVSQKPIHGPTGISHTRWATHGEVTRENAHPHLDASGQLALVHNGVIENYLPLKHSLTEKGHKFLSQTDTEVLAHLIGEKFDALADITPDALIEAVRQSLLLVSGTYGIALIHSKIPHLIIGARKGSPLVVGVDKNRHFLASDVSALVNHTREVIYLNDFDIVTLSPDNFQITTLRGNNAKFQISTVEFAPDDADKGTFPHFMLKEIHEQPNAIRDAMRGRIAHDDTTAKLGGLEMSNNELLAVERIVLCGCGSAYHAAMTGEYIIEGLARLPVECEFASELRYRNLPTTRGTLVFVISQSGETADTLGALRECRRKGHRTLGICNNVASTLARESDGGVYMHAGPEIGVAATKSFTSQLTILSLLALLFGRMHILSYSDGKKIIHELEALPDKISQILQLENHIASIAKKYAHASHFLFLGRQANYPIALEAALKLKEISYISASGHPSAELKHGIIALVNESTPSVFIVPNDAVREKNISNIQEVKARKGPVIAVATEGDHEIQKIVDDTIFIPEALEFFTPILSVVPLQLLAYHVAVTLGCDVDKPRNLAKSVTVE